MTVLLSYDCKAFSSCSFFHIYIISTRRISTFLNLLFFLLKIHPPFFSYTIDILLANIGIPLE